MSLPRARARRLDPTTSHDAAFRVERSGKAADQRTRCLDALKRIGRAATSAELARAMGVDRHVTARRLPELRDGGLVRQGEKRECEVLGTECLTWEPKVEGEADGRGQLQLFTRG